MFRWGHLFSTKVKKEKNKVLLLHDMLKKLYAENNRLKKLQKYEP